MNSDNVSVTDMAGQSPNLEDKQFTCPLCYAGLLLKSSKKGKPYCVCNMCGIQIFFRGRAAIERLGRLAMSGLIGSLPSADDKDSLERYMDALFMKTGSGRPKGRAEFHIERRHR